MYLYRIESFSTFSHPFSQISRTFFISFLSDNSLRFGLAVAIRASMCSILFAYNQRSRMLTHLFQAAVNWSIFSIPTPVKSNHPFSSWCASEFRVGKTRPPGVKDANLKRAFVQALATIRMFSSKRKPNKAHSNWFPYEARSFDTESPFPRIDIRGSPRQVSCIFSICSIGKEQPTSFKQWRVPALPSHTDTWLPCFLHWQGV